jgi:hypothetical protein
MFLLLCVYMHHWSSFIDLSTVRRFVILEFLNNEDIKYLYVFSKSLSQLSASRHCNYNSNEKGIFFLKTNSTKLSVENMSKYFEILRIQGTSQYELDFCLLLKIILKNFET